MGMKIRLPSGRVLRIAVMSFVTVDEHLQGCDTPTLLTHLTEMQQLFHCRIIIDYDYTLFKWSAATHYGHLTGLFVHSLTVFSLHSPTCLFLYHLSNLIIAVSQ